jgi:hypothetical protein
VSSLGKLEERFKRNDVLIFSIRYSSIKVKLMAAEFETGRNLNTIILAVVIIGVVGVAGVVLFLYICCD